MGERGSDSFFLVDTPEVNGEKAKNGPQRLLDDDPAASVCYKAG